MSMLIITTTWVVLHRCRPRDCHAAGEMLEASSVQDVSTRPSIPTRRNDRQSSAFEAAGAIAGGYRMRAGRARHAGAGLTKRFA